MIMTLLLIFFSCDKKESTPQLGIQDTVTLSLNLNVGGTSYSFSLKPGDSETTSASQIYENLGSDGSNINNKLEFLDRYIQLTDRVKNVRVSVGFSFHPGQVIYTNSDDKCFLLDKEMVKYFVPKSYPICSSWGGGDFLSCSNGSQDAFYFQIWFDDLAGKKYYKSGIQQVAGSFFRIDKIQKLSFVDKKSSTGSFDYLIQGEFNIPMQAYKFGVPDSPNPETLTMENSQFTLGIQDLCINY